MATLGSIFTSAPGPAANSPGGFPIAPVSTDPSKSGSGSSTVGPDGQPWGPGNGGAITGYDNNGQPIYGPPGSGTGVMPTTAPAQVQQGQQSSASPSPTDLTGLLASLGMGSSGSSGTAATPSPLGAVTNSIAGAQNATQQSNLGSGVLNSDPAVQAALAAQQANLAAGGTQTAYGTTTTPDTIDENTGLPYGASGVLGGSPVTGGDATTQNASNNAPAPTTSTPPPGTPPPTPTTSTPPPATPPPTPTTSTPPPANLYSAGTTDQNIMMALAALPGMGGSQLSNDLFTQLGGNAGYGRVAASASGNPYLISAAQALSQGTDPQTFLDRMNNQFAKGRLNADTKGDLPTLAQLQQMQSYMQQYGVTKGPTAGTATSTGGQHGTGGTGTLTGDTTSPTGQSGSLAPGPTGGTTTLAGALANAPTSRTGTPTDPTGSTLTVPGLNGMSQQDFATMLGIPVTDPRIAQYMAGQTPAGAESIQQLQAQMAQNPQYAQYATNANAPASRAATDGSAVVPGTNGMTAQMLSTMLGIPLTDPRIAQYMQGQTPTGAETMQQLEQQMAQNPQYAGYVPSGSTTPPGSAAPPPTSTTPATTPPGTTPAGGSAPGDTFQEAPGNYTGGMTLANYLDPSYAFRLKQGLDSAKSSYGAAGDFLSGSTAKGLNDYAADSASQEYAAANQRYMADKAFNLGSDQADRAFNYTAQLNDQTIPFNQQLQLEQLGLTGAGQNSTLAAALASILSQNAVAAGTAAGTGTVGQNNAITSAISSWLQQNQSNATLQQILAAYGKTPTGTG